jgi:hypothetical protein
VNGVRYDPSVGPDPTAWLALGEAEQLEIVLRDHEREEAAAGSAQMHAVIHTAVETQLAQGHACATAALSRLAAAGLDRHEAVHAVGRVLGNHIYRTLKGGKEFDAAAYDRELNQLTAESWRMMAEDG